MITTIRKSLFATILAMLLLVVFSGCSNDQDINNSDKVENESREFDNKSNDNLIVNNTNSLPEYEAKTKDNKDYRWESMELNPEDYPEITDLIGIKDSYRFLNANDELVGIIRIKITHNQDSLEEYESRALEEADEANLIVDLASKAQEENFSKYQAIIKETKLKQNFLLAIIPKGDIVFTVYLITPDSDSQPQEYQINEDYFKSSLNEIINYQEVSFNKQDQKSTNPKNSLLFSNGEYSLKDLAISDHVGDLDPNNNPNLQQFGTPAISIIEKNDGYSRVRVNYLATEINLPFGWLNIGGYTSLDKVFFYPKGSYQPDVDSSLPINYISLVALDSNMLGVTKYEEVLAKVQEMQDSFGKNRLIEIKDGYSFAFELIHPEHNYTKKPQGVIDIYIKNPDFNSTIWLNLQLSVPASEFEKYKNLSEIAYNSLNIDWDLLQQQIDYFLNENNQIEDLDRLLENLAEEIYL